MTSTAAAVKGTQPPDNELVLGTVASLVPFVVNTRNGPVNNPGVLGSYRPGLGDPVQMMRQNGTWLVMGSSASAVNAAAGIASFNDDTANDNTALGTFTNLDPVRFGFVKRLPGSNVVVNFHCSVFISASSNTNVEFGLDFLAASLTAVTQRVVVCGMQINPLNTHTMISATVPYGNIAAGIYTIQALWRRSAGAGTINIAPTDDWVSIMVTEV